MDSDQKIESRFHRTFALPKSIDSFGENQSAILRRRAKSADFRRGFPSFPRRVTSKANRSQRNQPPRRATPKGGTGRLLGAGLALAFIRAYCSMANLFISFGPARRASIRSISFCRVGRNNAPYGRVDRNLFI